MYLGLMVACLVGFIYLFYKWRMNRIRFLLTLLCAMVIQTVVLISWEYFFSSWGVWHYHIDHLSGISWFTLPVEVYFSAIIFPSTVYLFGALFDKKYPLVSRQNWVVIVGILLFLLSGWMVFSQYEKLYTASVFLASAFLLFLHLTIFQSYKSYFINFIRSFTMGLFPFIGLQLLLIETGAVTYDATQTMGINLGNMPLENVAFYFFYFLLFYGSFQWINRLWVANGNEETVA